MFDGDGGSAPGPCAHHDGSEAYLSPQRPELGDEVRVTLSVPGSWNARRVLVRVVSDGEPHFHDALREVYEDLRAPDPDGDEELWLASFPLANNVQNYRFLVVGERRALVVNARGCWDRDVPDGQDFRVVAGGGAPDWAVDGLCCQVFIDRFARATDEPPLTAPDWAVPAQWETPVASNTPQGVLQLYGGSLWGILEHLDHLAGLGVTIIYLTPFFPAHSNHRYDASTFDHVDELLGGDEALRALTTACRERGIRVIGDLTLNHTGVGHEWFHQALADPGSPERGFYLFEDDSAGPGYSCFWGEPSLPRLDHRSQEMRRRLYEGPDSVVARYVRDLGLSGWRIDVAQSAGIHGASDLNREVARITRETLANVDPQAWLVAEIQHDGAGALQGDGWQGSMAYAAFTRPVWSWLGGADVERQWGVPVSLARLDGVAMVQQMEDFTSLVPWSARVGSMNLLDSHDTARFRTIAGRKRQAAALAMMLTMPGIPMIFAGDEVGVEGSGLEDGRRPFPWHGPWDDEMLALHRRLIMMRHEHRALRRGSMRWVRVEAETVCYERRTGDERILIQIARGPHQASVASRDWVDLVSGRTVHSGDPMGDGAPGWTVWGEVR